MKPYILAIALLVAACSQKDDAPPPPKAQEGRAETKNIRNVKVMGYDGKVIADKVDAGLNANDEAIKKAEQESEEKKEEQ